jgi:hypothetical protein
MGSPDPVATLRGLRGVDVGVAGSEACARLLGESKRLRGWIDAFEARVTSRLQALHAQVGAAPAADVHAKCGGVSAGEGKRKERRAETLDDARSFGDALAAGDIGAEHVDALAGATVGLDDELKARLLEHEDDLLDDARRLPPERFGRACRDLARRLERDRGIERNRRQRRETFLARKLNLATGMIEGRFAFHPELANQLFGALDQQVAAMITHGEAIGDPAFVERAVDRNRLAAEALGQLVAAGHHHERPLEADITVIVDAATLATGEWHDDSVCETSHGLPLPPESIRRLVCNGKVTPIYVDANGTPFDRGRTIRHATRDQRRALRAMYRNCAFGECDVPFDRCEIHHIVPWDLDGLTDMANLLPLCSRHHHVVHEHGWSLQLADDRTLTIRQPDGTVFTVCEPDVPPHRQRSRAGRRRTAA